MNFNNRTFHLLLKADILTCYEQVNFEVRFTRLMPGLLAGEM